MSDQGVTGSTDEVGEKHFISWKDIREVWMPQHKWSSAIESHQEITQSDIFQEVISGQNRAIEQLQKTIHQLTSKSPNPIPSIQLNTENVLSPISTESF